MHTTPACVHETAAATMQGKPHCTQQHKAAAADTNQAAGPPNVSALPEHHMLCITIAPHAADPPASSDVTHANIQSL
jgi:hypothetical protein